MTQTFGGTATAPSEPYLRLTLENVLVSSYSTGGSGSKDIPTESISLNFEKIRVAYTSSDTTGNPTGERVEVELPLSGTGLNRRLRS